MSKLIEQLETRLCLSGETGLRGDYYESSIDLFSQKNLAVAAPPTFTQTDPTVAFTPAPAASEIRWSGQVMSEEAGSYTFNITTDGGARLWVNNQLILNSWGPQGASTTLTSSPVTLAANTQYCIRLDVMDAISAVELDWLRPSGVQEVVPQSQLYPFSQPIQIKTGGYYVGNWESTTTSVKAVDIHTTQPVVIDDSTIRAAGILIDNSMPGFQLTVENTFGYGLNPNIAGVSKGDFLYAQSPASLIVQNNTIVGVGGWGIHVYGFWGNGVGSQTIKILNNSILNSDGRESDGAGGYLQAGNASHSILIQNVYNLAGIEIGWNQIINQPGQSYVNDVINLFDVIGTPASPVDVHDNYVQGLYTLNIATQYDSGSGITADGGGGILTEPAYINIHDNEVVSTGSAGIGVPTGHDILVYNNRLVSSGYLADGTSIYASGTGVYINDLSNSGPTLFYNNGAFNNISGWVEPPHTKQNGGSQAQRKDYSFVSATPALTYNNVDMTGTITTDTEAAESANWQAKYPAANESIGASLLPGLLALAPVVVTSDPPTGSQFVFVPIPTTLVLNGTQPVLLSAATPWIVATKGWRQH